MFAVTIIAFIVALNRKKDHQNLWPIYYYILVSLVQDVATTYVYFFISNSYVKDKLDRALTALFALAEFGLFNIVIIINLKHRVRKIVTKFIVSLFYFAIFSFTFLRIDGETYYQAVLSLDSVCLILVSFFYFYEILNETKIVAIKEEPTFWVIVAILFYASCSLPIYVFKSYLEHNLPENSYSIFSINFLLY